LSVKDVAGIRRRRVAWATRIAILAALIVVWQIAAVALGPLFLPQPLAVVYATITLFGNGTIELALEQSMTVYLIAFGISLAIGIPLGLVMGGVRAVGDAVDSFINLFNSMPRIALIPLMVAWFGLGVTAKIAIVILLAFFPIVINTYNGVLNTDKDLLEAATSFGASRGQLFTRVMLRAALSNIITGIRLGRAVYGDHGARRADSAIRQPLRAQRLLCPGPCPVNHRGHDFRGPQVCREEANSLETIPKMISDRKWNGVRDP
jgi:ABC-type nitrate/sulfonate/bicarbonate transport system permease component